MAKHDVVPPFYEDWSVTLGKTGDGYPQVVAMTGPGNSGRVAANARRTAIEGAQQMPSMTLGVEYIRDDLDYVNITLRFGRIVNTSGKVTHAVPKAQGGDGRPRQP